MENTGRLKRSVTPTARRILFSGETEGELRDELRLITEVDRAHLVMLVERGLVEREKACAILGVIDRLRASGYTPLQGRPAPRGLYLLYESYLIETLGAETGGVLHIGRSRNDLKATTLRLRLREPCRRLLAEALRLQATLLTRARRFSEVVMPAYTHYRPAVPITYGHYLCGMALALHRDTLAILHAAAEMERCPLGAGAVGGTSVPIDSARTAALLGFREPVLHSVDAVASRSVVLRLLSGAAILGITLSRMAADLLEWSTMENALLWFPDSVVGSSSMMPQKRNPFLLEHVQGRSAGALGAFVEAAGAMHAKPFTNHIAVGTDGIAPVWDALRKTTEAAVLARLVVAGARPLQENMIRRAEEGYTSATELANRLATSGGMAFRSAHQMVGTVVREAVEKGGESLTEAAARVLSGTEVGCTLDGLDPASVAESSRFGGGAGSASFRACWEETHGAWLEARGQTRAMAQRWQAATAALQREVISLCAPRPA